MRKKSSKYRWYSYQLLINPDISKCSGAYVGINNMAKKPDERFRKMLKSLNNKKIKPKINH